MGIALALALALAFGAGVVTTWVVAPRVAALRDPLAGPPAGPTASASPTAEASPTPDREALVERLWEVWDLLEGEYLHPEKLDAEEMMRAAIAASVQEVGDPYTIYVEPVSAGIIEQDMQGEFEGIGATVGAHEDGLTIVSFLEGSPGEKAGLRLNDVILEADGKPLKGLGVADAIALIRGPRGSVVRLLVRRAGVEEPFIVPVTRERLELPTVEARMLEGKVGYVALAEFNAVARDRLREALRDLLAEKPVGLVLDLRGNPGGYLVTAVEVAEEFLPRGTLVVREEQRDVAPHEYTVSRRGLATDIPLVVLVDGGSASASEIVAGAIRDHDRGTLVGEQTYGKGSVQYVHSLSDGASLRVTVARYYLPDGDNLDGNGIVPDVVVQYTQEDADAGRDPQLDEAVRLLTEGKG